MNLKSKFNSKMKCNKLITKIGVLLFKKFCCALRTLYVIGTWISEKSHLETALENAPFKASGFP